MPGTSASENNIGVKIDRQDGERILFFQTDSHECRAAFGLANDRPVCDVLVFYRATNQKPFLVFAEFKGGNIAHAIDQIESTVGAITPLIPRSVQSPKVIALIVSSASSPPGQAKLQKKLENLGITVNFKTGVRRGNIDLRPYLKQ